MRIEDHLTQISGLSEAEQNVASYIIDNPRALAQMSIHDLAAKTFTSTTTILRLCKKIGLSGFKELKMRLIQDYRLELAKTSDVDANYPFSELVSEMDIARTIAGLTRDTINACLLTLDEKSLWRAVGMLFSAESIIAIGVSDSFIRLIDFQNKMLKINTFVKITYLQPDQAFLCTHATGRDVGLLVSYSGRTAETLNEAHILKQRSVPMIAITSDAESPLAELADVIIRIPDEENVRVADYSLSSQLAIEYALNVLFSCVYAAKYQENREHLFFSRHSYLHE